MRSMGAETLMVVMFKAGGVAIVSSIVEKGLEVMGKEEFVGAVKVLSFTGIAYFACKAIYELMNYAGRLFL
jgi:hypothetical protein